MVKEWAVILGASSGFGEAAALELARDGFNIFGVHLDLRKTLPNAVRIQDEIRAIGPEAMFFNVNAADPGKRANVIEAIRDRLGQDEGSFVGVLLHSLAFGTLLPYFGDTTKESMSQKQIEMTLDVMAHSLLYWTQELVRHNLLQEGSRIFAMTSAGATRVIESYGAVSVAKAALEAHIRQIAFELAPEGIRANAIRAGVTDTPSLQRIPGGSGLLEMARERNPSGRTTKPEDVARVIAALVDGRFNWVTGEVMGVDGGETLRA